MPLIDTLLVHGFQHSEYTDKLNNNNIYTDNDEYKRIISEIDRVYLNTNIITLLNTNFTDLNPSPKPFLTVEKSAQIAVGNNDTTDATAVTTTTTTDSTTTGTNNSIPCDVVFWNPWIDKSKTLSDLDNEAYLEYICVEPGCVSQWVDVTPGCMLQLSQKLQVL